MIQHQCQDCDFRTYDDADAEDHQKETDHCMVEAEVWDNYDPVEDS